MPKLDPQEARNVAELMRSGRYFSEARAWFDARYHWVSVERSWLIVITAVAVACIWFCLSAVQSFLPLKPVRSYPMAVANEAEYQLSISSLREGDEPRGDAVLRFLLKDYVLSREAYDSDTLDFAQRRVRALSSDAVFQGYLNAMYAGNPESPINLYGRAAARRVQILSFGFAGEGGQRRAVIRFRAGLRSKGAAQVDARPMYYQANIAFRFSDIRVDEKTNTFTPLEFRVESYTVEPYQP